MRRTRTFEGKRHVYDTKTAIERGHRSEGGFGDPAGFEETLYQTKGGLYFVFGQGGEDSPYPADGDIKPLSKDEAESWS